MKTRLGFALLALMAVTVAACGHNGSATSTLPAVRDPAGTGRSASAPFVPVVSPSPILYVSGNDRVVAFPLAASGAATPLRTLFVHRLQQDGIVGIATNSDTSLDVLQNFRNSPTGPGTPNAAGNYPDCRVVIYPATASGDAAAMNQFSCFHSAVGPGTAIGGVRGLGIARAPSPLGAIDYLEAALPPASPSPGPTPGDFVQRSNESGADHGLLAVASPSPVKYHNGMAENITGNVFVSYSLPFFVPIPSGSSSNSCVATPPTATAAVDEFAPAAIGTPGPIATIVINGRVTAGALATYPVSDPFKRIYVATCDSNANSWVDELLTGNLSSGTTVLSPSRSIGPFTNASVTALAVDAQGNIYVGLSDNPVTASTGTAVRVYGPNFVSGSKVPLHSIEGPLVIPANGNQRITGLAITQ